MGIIDFEELRNTITADYTDRINLLKKDMAGELALLDKLEGRVVTGRTKGARIATKGGSRTRPHRKASGGGVKKPSAKERILAAKQVLQGEFSRKDLLEVVNADGGEPMRKGTFSPYVSAMVGKEIVEVGKAIGNNPSTYKWNEEI